jgi:chromosome segregation ATPase
MAKEEKKKSAPEKKPAAAGKAAEGKKAKAELMEASFKLEQLSSQVSSLERKVEVGEDRLRREVADYEARIAQAQDQAKEQAAKIRENDKATDALKQAHEAALRQASDEAERQSDDYKKQMGELQKQLKRKVLEQDALQEKVAKSAAEAMQHLDLIRNLTASLVQLDAGHSRKRAELENRIVEQRDRVRSLEQHVSRVAAKAKSSAPAAQSKSSEAAAAEKAKIAMAR